MLDLTLGRDRQRFLVAVDEIEFYKLGAKCFSICKIIVLLDL
jgi:hypothetical protein